jgi:predicted nucleic acid-binding protein
MANEPALLDTNGLVYSLYQNSPQHAVSRTLVESASDSDASLFVAPQSLAEFFAIVTNPRRVDNPQKPEAAVAAIERFMVMPGLKMAFQPVDVVTRWCELVRQRPVTGADIFDLQLVATMLANGIHRIFTFNRDDFTAFPQIEVLTP